MIRDEWGNDSQTGARGLVRGTRIVRNGQVKIGGDFYVVRGHPKPIADGTKVELHVRDSLATVYGVFEPDRGIDIGEAKVK